MAQKWPKMTQNGPKWPKYDPKWPKMAQNGPRMTQNDPKWPKITPNGPKMMPGFTHFFRKFFFLLKKRFRKLFRFYNVWFNLLFQACQVNLNYNSTICASRGDFFNENGTVLHKNVRMCKNDLGVILCKYGTVFRPIFAYDGCV